MKIPGLLSILLLLGGAAQAAELRLTSGSTERTWQTEELLGHPQAQQIEIAEDVSYRRTMSYRAVPLASLLEGVEAGDHLQAVALDGFAAELPAALLLGKRGARAWLAIEEPTRPWPPLAPGKPSAGPFYLVWQNPEAGQVGPEQWPYQLAQIRTLAPVAERFPQLLPATDADAQSQAGFAQFQKHCMACHRLNAAGDSAFGPDLNIPHNPTEYFAGDFLQRYIRDPQSLRRWPQGRMPGFSEAQLSDVEMAQLLAYLRHMAKRKTTAE